MVVVSYQVDVVDYQVVFVDYQVDVVDYQEDVVDHQVVVVGYQVNQVDVLKPLLFCSGELARWESQFAEKVDKK